MIIDYPEYFETFACAAGACPDTCCSTWEVDVDDDSYYYYQVVPGAFGEKLRSNIVWDGEDKYFPMREDGYCPFLTKEKLCEIHCRLGQEYVCKVCTEYPRYYMETGEYRQLDISLSCIEMAQRFFETTDPVRYVHTENDAMSGRDPLPPFEEELLKQALAKRTEAVEALSAELTSEKPDARACLERAGLFVPVEDEDLLSVVREFEALNRGWEKDLAGLEKLVSGEGSREKAEKQLLAACPEFPRLLTKFALYLSWRYVIDASLEAEEGDEISFYPEARLFSRCLRLVELLCMIRAAERAEEKGAFDHADMADVVHGFSKEVEHSEENLDQMKFA